MPLEKFDSKVFRRRFPECFNRPSRDNEYQSLWWSIDLPFGWKVDDSEHPVAISAERGMGELLIGAYRNDTEPITDEALMGLAEQEAFEFVPQTVCCGDLKGIAVSYSDSEYFWRKLWLRSKGGHLLLLVVYSCALGDESVEQEYVDRILSSLKSRLRIGA